MTALEITPDDMRPADLGAHARLMNLAAPQDASRELTAILAELCSLNHKINALIPRVRAAIGAAVDNRANIKMSDILRVTASHFDVKEMDILSARRTRKIARPRQIAMYLCRNLTPRTYPEIGMFFDKRDHTTVMHAVNKIIQLMDQDRQLSQSVGLLADRIIKGEVDVGA